ncbi:hypothetical protein CLI92_09010 [Vandammella animalimorsus]|uniref:Uncharacterized protein n=1 Tax=Vandammella animalimorsus TaxID=2029117 RepID=A0A2A2T4P7_9BURK|nr:LPD38 domain-containing protein [Vandammella animalimorsus]PAT31890.1 hypothetical protein CK626_07795 [Vandammella animalimorsus]PAX16463.1 hypothetical protein CLI92_09010 [Vandammella animalimorsus]PAX18878.1 hypothetical protein CLI93_11090 [Vandammella animalimorsus]
MPTNQEQENPFGKISLSESKVENPFAVFAKKPQQTHQVPPQDEENPFGKIPLSESKVPNPFAVFAKKNPQPEPVPQPEAKPEYTWGETVANTAMALGSKLNQGALEFSAALARRAQAPTSSVLADALSAAAAVDRGITDSWNFFGGDAKYSKSLQRQAQMASDFAAEQRAENEKNNVVAGLLGRYLDANQKARAEYQDFDQTMNPQFAAQQQAVADAKGFWGTTKAYAQNPMALAGDVAGSAPAMLAGAGLARAVGAATLARGGTMAQATARASTAGLLAEGATSGLMGREQLYGKVSQMPYAQLMESPRFEELVKGGMSFKQARERLANELADQVTLPAAMATIAGGKLMNWLFRGDASAALLAGQKATLKTIPRNAAQEGAEEAVQSVGEEAASHRAEQQADVHADFDLGGTLARGLMTGAAMGAGGAAGSALDWRGRKGAGAAAAQAQGEGDEPDDGLDEGPGEGQQPAAPAAQQAFSREGYVQYRRTLESGGNPQAKAKTSSAFGIDQFLDGTWLDVVAQAKPDWAEGLTREQLLAQRANPQRSGEMADFLDRQNAQRLQSQGLEVNNHNLYAMHHFGAKGLTFAKAAMDVPMAQILTEAQLKANPYLAKMSKAQLIAHWDKRAGVQAAAGHDTPSTRVHIDDAADARAAEIEVLQSMGENLTDAQRARLGQLQAEEAAAQPARSFEQELAEAAELDGQAQQAQQAGQAQSVPGRAAEMVLQNRDRSTAASIEQMNAIAAKPDYLRTGPSRTMDQGAPVVFGDFPASSILGREETVADGRGDRVKTRYAVVDAADVIPSNTADGLPVQSYAAGEPGKLRAVAGNGRAAGLIEAYNRGTAGQYRQELMEDAQSLGIEPAHIERLQSPMLVRIMDEADVTPDIGDRSNTVATARLSPLEEASNDAKRVNLAALEFGEDGSPTAASLRGFINAMPEAERGNMLGPDGAPTRQAVDRLMAAAFKQAYGNDELVKLHAQATDPEARTVMAALADSAGAMAQLAGAGEFDIRQAVADAAALAVNARRKGRTLAQEVQNLDLDMNPEALVIAQFMAQNIRSARRIADGLRNFAQRALQQVQIAQQNAVQGGMFGDQPTLTRKQLFEEFGNAHQQPAAQPGAARAESGQAPAAQPGRAGPDAQLAQPERAHARAAGSGPADRAQGGAAAGQDGRVEAAAGAAAGPGSADRPDVRLSRQKGQAQELGQTQQQYKDTERAYGGRAAYDRAKAAGKTKLSYGQWVQVRTPSFKQWFGDWELAGLAKSMRRVRGSNQAKEVRAEIVGAELVNLESGFTATVSGESFAKMMSRSNVERSVSSQAHMQALGNIDKLFALARVREVRAPKKVHDAGDMAAVHHFEVPMPFDGQVLRVKIMGKEFVSPDKGNRLYLIEAVEIENAGVEGEDPRVSGQFQRGGETASSPLPGADARFAQMVEAVNGDGVSKAVDPDTGEPLATHLDGGHEFEQTARAYGGRAAYDRAKAAGKTKLSYGQWVQVRTPSFKQWFGDWEAVQNVDVLQGPAVAVLEGHDAPHGYPALREWALAQFQKVGGKATNPEIGDVALDMRAVRDSMAHGMNPFKAEAFAAVAPVIEKGAVVARGEGGKSVYISAPVKIRGVDDVVTVLVHREEHTQRMYVHSVTTKENLLKARDSSSSTAASATSSGKVTSGDVASVLHNLLTFNPSEVSKAVDPDTGEPLATHLDGGHEFEQTARAYGGKAAWEKAKAEGQTKLTYHQWVQVRTPAFKKWWGYDWQADQANERTTGARGTGAVAQSSDRGGDRGLAQGAARGFPFVSPNGEPRVFYHGTRDAFSAFDVEHPNKKDVGWLGRGHYVTSDRWTAEYYAKAKRGESAPRVMELFARPFNALELTQEDKARFKNLTAKGAQSLSQQLLAKGYGGTYTIDEDGGIEFAVFDARGLKSATGNSGDFDAQNPDIRYSRRQQAAGQQRAEQVRRTVDGIRRHWKNAPEVVVAASLHDEAIPEELRSAVQAKQGQGAPEGFFHDGKVYLIADRLPKPRDVARVLLHEALGHWGLRGVFGKRLTLVLRDIQAARPQEVIAKAREYGLHGLGQAKEASNSEIWKSMSQEQRDEAAEEVLASMAQHQPQLGFVRRAVAAMRSWLREHVPLFNELALTQDEIVNNYLLPARRWVERSAKAGVAGGRPALSRSRPRPASDAEKARILQGEPVARLATKDAPSGSYADVVQAVARMFARQGGVATRQDIGEVVLDERAAKSSMAHGGANAYKRAAFAAVKDVIERGAVVMQAQHARDGTSFYIAAPVTIDGSDNMVTVLVRKDANTQRMYLHSVMLKENLLKPSVSAADAEASEPHSATTSGDAQSIAQNTHEREAVESPLKRRVSSVDAKASERSGSSASGDSWSIAQNAHKREATKSLLDLRVSRTDTASGVERSGSTNQEGKATVPPSPQEGKAAPEAVADELRRLLTLDVQAGLQDVRFSRSQRVRAAANAALDKVGDWMDDSLEIPEHWSPAEKSAASKFDRYSKKQPLSERVREIGHNARDRVVQGVVDQFRPLKGLSKTAWMQAQLSKGTDGAVEAVATLGIPVLKDGAIAVETDQYPEGFLGELSKQLGSTEEVRNFFMYVVGNRADRLSKEWTVTYADGTTVRYKDQATALQAAKGKPGAKAQAASRENLFNAEEIEAMKNKLYGKMANGRPRPEAYHNALVALNRYNRSILDIAEAAGLIDPESRKQWESDFYVPFYRVSAENNTAFDFSSKGTGLARQQVIRRLEGGTDKLGDPLENLMANWHAMLTASMRNLAANNALNAAQSMGEARQVKEPVEGGTWTMQGGKKVYWQVDDPLVLIALESLNFNGYNNALMRTAGKAKHMLTVGVTASPVFRIRNLIRDTLQATATADVGYDPIGNALEGLALTAKGSDTRAQLIAGGGAVRFGSFNDGNQAQHYERMIAKGIEEGQILDTPQKIRRFFGDALNNYQEVGDRIEMVNRAVIYQRTLAKTKSHLEASFEARDLMNFTSMGSFAAVRAIAQVVPFANARVQGMDRLVRGAARDPRRFWAVTGLIGMASAVLYLLNADDDEYRAMPDYIRNTYWPVKMGGKWYYIPKPFEVGAMGTVVERFTELVFSDGDYQAKDFKDSVMSILMNSLSMNLTPQLIKPAAEAWFNYDMFREQAIEGMALERLLPEDRYDANTSAAAIAAGRALGASPKKIEHLIRGYFGWLGVQALNAGDWMARPMMDLPESPKSDLSSVNNWFVVGDMVKDSGTIPSKYAERFYRLQSEINEIYASASNARRLGELQRYQELVSRPEMAAYPVLHQAQKGVTLINQQMRLTLASSAPAAEKNRRLQELRARRDEIARRVDKIVREAQMWRKGG